MVLKVLSGLGGVAVLGCLRLRLEAEDVMGVDWPFGGLLSLVARVAARVCFSVFTHLNFLN